MKKILDSNSFVICLQGELLLVNNDEINDAFDLGVIGVVEPELCDVE